MLWRRGYLCVEVGHVWKSSVLSAQSFYVPETVLKMSILKKENFSDCRKCNERDNAENLVV